MCNREKVQELEIKKKNLENEILELQRKRDRKEEDLLEIKMQRIAMGEITRCSKEKLFRNTGIVKSFYN